MGEEMRAVVETSAGKVEGCYSEGLFIFKGVPYAAPPTGPLRWMPPEEVKPWQGVRPAFEFAKVAPQIPPPPGVLDALNIVEPQDEDCLYLNVWTPGSTTSDDLYLSGSMAGLLTWDLAPNLSMTVESSRREGTPSWLQSIIVSVCWGFSTSMQLQEAESRPPATRAFSTRLQLYGGYATMWLPSEVIHKM